MATSNGSLPTRDLLPGSAGRDPVLICFSHLRWNFVYQRPQHLLSRAARSHRVIYFEEPVHSPDAEENGRLECTIAQSGVMVVRPVLREGLAPASETRQQRALLTNLLKSLGRRGGELIAWYYTPMALRFSDHLLADLVVYDCMDELSLFKGAPARLGRLEHALFERADVVFTGGHSLYEAKKRQHSNVHAFPSSIDVAHFGRARSKATRDPADQDDVARPRVGFFGVVDERMDLDLVAGMADAAPDIQFVMLGPVVKIEPGSLPRRSNIHWLGSKPYSELPDYLAHWDAGFMPFALNDATRYISPTKTPEFLAAGVPVISTAIRDVVRPYGEEGLVSIVRNADEAVAALRRWMADPKGRWLASVDRRLAGTSWDKTWARMQARLTEAKLALRAGEVRDGRTLTSNRGEAAGV